MTLAERILVIGGMVNLVYGFVTGFLLVAARQNAPVAPKPLMAAHIGPLMQGSMLLGLIFAVQMVNLSATLETTGALLLTVGACLLAIKDTILWRQTIHDEFGQKPVLGLTLAALSALTSSVGLLILAVGVTGIF